MLSDNDLCKVFKEARVIAIVGAKDKPGQPVSEVGRYFIQAGYTVIPLHPTRSSAWGLPAYKNLAETSGPIDIVLVFRRPECCPEHAQETLMLAPLPGIFWMQRGIASEEAARLMREAGVTVEQDRCLMAEHRRLVRIGLLPERGF